MASFTMLLMLGNYHCAQPLQNRQQKPSGEHTSIRKIQLHLNWILALCMMCIIFIVLLANILSYLANSMPSSSNSSNVPNIEKTQFYHFQNYMWKKKHKLFYNLLFFLSLAAFAFRIEAQIIVIYYANFQVIVLW